MQARIFFSFSLTRHYTWGIIPAAPSARGASISNPPTPVKCLLLVFVVIKLHHILLNICLALLLQHVHLVHFILRHVLLTDAGAADFLAFTVEVLTDRDLALLALVVAHIAEGDAVVVGHVRILQKSSGVWKPLTIFFIRLTSLFTYGTIPAAPKARGLAYH